jgi:hypothetical protein
MRVTQMIINCLSSYQGSVPSAESGCKPPVEIPYPSSTTFSCLQHSIVGVLKKVSRSETSQRVIGPEDPQRFIGSEPPQRVIGPENLPSA